MQFIVLFLLRGLYFICRLPWTALVAISPAWLDAALIKSCRHFSTFLSNFSQSWFQKHPKNFPFRVFFLLSYHSNGDCHGSNLTRSSLLMISSVYCSLKIYWNQKQKREAPLISLYLYFEICSPLFVSSPFFVLESCTGFRVLCICDFICLLLSQNMLKTKTKKGRHLSWLYMVLGLHLFVSSPFFLVVLTCEKVSLYYFAKLKSLILSSGSICIWAKP